MPGPFDESRLDDEVALASLDHVLRPLAEAGARVRREEAAAADAITRAVAAAQDEPRPRAVVAAGPDSRLLRAVLEPWCPVPFVAWPGPGLPGWAGTLDLVAVLAPAGGDLGAASGVAEAVRRGCQLVVACPPHSVVEEHAAGRHATVLPTSSGDQLATAVVMLEFLDQVDLGPEMDPEAVAVALDEVAIACAPRQDLSVNPAKMLAIALADNLPLVWGGSVLAARAARRVSESLRRASGRASLAADAEHLLPVISAAPARDLFDDPFAETESPARPVLVVLDDGSVDPTVREQRGRLLHAATERGVRVETVSAHQPNEVARYASLMATGTYAAAYLSVGLGGPAAVQ